MVNWYAGKLVKGKPVNSRRYADKVMMVEADLRYEAGVNLTTINQQQTAHRSFPRNRDSSGSQCQFRCIINIPRLVLFSNCYVKNFDHSYGYAKNFMP